MDTQQPKSVGERAGAAIRAWLWYRFGIRINSPESKQEMVEILDSELAAAPEGEGEKKGTANAGDMTPQVQGNEETGYASLRTANKARQSVWCPEQVPDLSFRGNELAGEVGEVCNVIKKLERERLGWRGSLDTVEHLAEELADVVICADLIGIAAGIDLDAAVVAKFNATSERVGLPHKIVSLISSPDSRTGVSVSDPKEPAASPWIRTEERKPTEEDGDENKCVFVRGKGGYSGAAFYKEVIESPDALPFWMPIPPVPDKKEKDL